MHDLGEVAAVIEDHIWPPAVGAFDGLFDAPDSLFFGLPLPGKDRDAGGGDGGGSVVLGREDVARTPTQFGAEMDQCLDQHRGLDGHMQAAGDARALEGLRGAILLAQRHQPRHFRFGDGNFLAAPFGQTDIGDLAIGAGVLGGGFVTHNSSPCASEGTDRGRGQVL